MSAASLHVQHRFDLQFTVVATVHSHWVDFAIYDMVSWADDTPAWCALVESGGGGRVPVDSLEEAEVYLHGSVKWDGCSNWHFDEQDRVMLHGCGRADVQRFGDVMAMCWDWTAKLLPSWNGD